jgi:hypothetical protein
MSLINEALKKAQGDRPTKGPTNPSAGSGLPVEAHYTPPPKKNSRSYLWGFILSILIVGTFTVLLSTYFVFKLAGEDESKGNTSSQTVGQPAETVPEVVVLESPPTPQQAEAIPTQSDPAAKPVPVPEPEVVEPAEPIKPALPPDPAVIARLMELEIRGIMSGGTRVLIFDQFSNRNKAYRVGDSLEGPMGLVVENISNSSIKFKDYAGQIHTKSF